jgi:hypothetical protein
MGLLVAKTVPRQHTTTGADMIERHGSRFSENDRDEILADFKKAVNMTPADLKDWLATEESKEVGQKNDGGESVGHQSGKRIIELLQRKKSELDDDDLDHMRKVTGYVHRHLAQGPTKQDPATSKWRYSLMNWGHDPEKD